MPKPRAGSTREAIPPDAPAEGAPARAPAPARRLAAFGPRLALVVGLVLTVGLVALQVEYVGHAGSLWRDEVDSVNVATQPSLAEVLAHAHLDSFPVAWVTLLHAWITAGLGDTDAGLRRLGLVVGVATLGTLWWSGRRLGGVPLVALLLFGLSPAAIVYGSEVRGYGLGALAIAWCMGATWTYVVRPARATFAVAQLAALLAVQTYYANAFLLLAVAAGGAAVAARRGAWRTVAGVGALGAVAAASLALDYPGIAHAVRDSAIELGDYTLAERFGVFRDALAPGVPLLAALWPVAAVLAVAGCVRAWRSADREDGERALFLAVTVAVTVPAFAVYLVVLARVATNLWYYLSLMAVLVLACDAGIALLVRRTRAGEAVRAAVVALAALLVARDVAAAVRLRMTNLDVVAAVIAGEARPDDLVVVDPWESGLTFQRYYRGAAPWITLPDLVRHDFHYHTLVAEKMRLGDAGVAPELARVTATLQGGGRVWVAGVLRAPADDRPRPALPPAPSGPHGWQVAPYTDGWSAQLGALLKGHARDTWVIQLPDVGAVNAHEQLPLFRAEGWQ